MARLHICNTFFERELESGTKRPLVSWMRFHPAVMQLQFLPLLYAGPDDLIAVSDLPEKGDPRLCLIDQPPKGYLIEDWGPSLAIAEWAKKHGLCYDMPDWEKVKKINSKVFSFTESPKLPGAKLLETSEEIAEWLAKTSGPKVLKTPFGTAGGGHRINPNVYANNLKNREFGKEAAPIFCSGASSFAPEQSASEDKKFAAKPTQPKTDSSGCLRIKQLYIGPMIGEPWVERVMDFSTQWKNGKLVGVTVFENRPNGTYRGTVKGEVEPWALQEHLDAAHPLIEKMGYLGHVGIDAFIYLWEGKKQVHPVVEINARKTMSWVALQMKEKCLYYDRAEEGLLPSKLGATRFATNVTIDKQMKN